MDCSGCFNWAGHSENNSGLEMIRYCANFLTLEESKFQPEQKVVLYDGEALSSDIFVSYNDYALELASYIDKSLLEIKNTLLDLSGMSHLDKSPYAEAMKFIPRIKNTTRLFSEESLAASMREYLDNIHADKNASESTKRCSRRLMEKISDGHSFIFDEDFYIDTDFMLATELHDTIKFDWSAHKIYRFLNTICNVGEGNIFNYRKVKMQAEVSLEKFNKMILSYVLMAFMSPKLQSGGLQLISDREIYFDSEVYKRARSVGSVLDLIIMMAKRDSFEASFDEKAYFEILPKLKSIANSLTRLR